MIFFFFFFIKTNCGIFVQKESGHIFIFFINKMDNAPEKMLYSIMDFCVPKHFPNIIHMGRGSKESNCLNSNISTL